MTRGMRAVTLPSRLLPNTRGIPRRRANNLQTPRNSGARPTRICRSFGVFKSGFPRGADEAHAFRVVLRENHAFDHDYAPQAVSFLRLPCNLDCIACLFLSSSRRPRE